MKLTKWTQFTGSREFGVAEETLARALRKAGLKTGKGKTYATLEIHTVLAGDVRGERTRLLRAKADEQELKNKVRDGELITRDVAERELWFNLYLPLLQSLQAMPDEISPRCVSPDAARVAMIQHIEKIKSQIREPKSKTP